MSFGIVGNTYSGGPPTLAMRRNQELHKRNLQRIKPAIDNKWGAKKNGVTDLKQPTYSHLSSNAARMRREDERWREVEKENQHLLSKMARIMRSIPFDESREFLPGIRLNPGNEPRMDTQIANVTYSRGAASFTVKRNQAIVSKQLRDHHLKKISDENMALVRRLQATAPAYPVDRLEEERRETEHLLRSICHYPYQAGSWAKDRRGKPKPGHRDGGSSLGEASTMSAASRSRSQTAPAQLQVRPDEAGLITFEVVASEYTFPAGHFEIPLSGALPLTVNAGGKSILSLSSAQAGSAGGGGFRIQPSAKKAPAPRGRPSPAARR